jgi:hypothetical protein
MRPVVFKFIVGLSMIVFVATVALWFSCVRYEIVIGRRYVWTNENNSNIRDWYAMTQDHGVAFESFRITLSLAQARRVAEAFGVSLSALLSPAAGGSFEPTQRMNFVDLAERLRPSVERDGLGPVEDGVGWYLGGFLSDPSSAWDQPLDFLKDVCGFLRVPWLNVITD